jgi:TonB family protein
MVSKLALNLTACALVLSGISVTYPSNAAPAKKPVAKRAVAPIKKPSPTEVLATHLVLNSLAPGANVAEACRRADFKSLATALSMNADLLHQEKGEYETSDQFAVRVSRLASALGGNETIFCQPLNDNEDLPFFYDADTQKFEASFDKNQNVWRDVKQLGSYRTTTRMGVPLTVKASVEFEYNASLTIPKPDESCGASASYPFNYRFTVPASLSEAPILKARGFVAFIGKLVPPYVTEEQNSGSPSLDDPNDIQTVIRTVSLKTNRIILVNGAGKQLWSCNLGLLLPKAAPTPLRQPWVSTNDYPSRALQQELEGTTSFRVSVGTNGGVLGCIITQSSGHDDLDTVTCTNVMKRARFYPATSADGSPIEGVFDGDVNWRIPR